MTFGRWAKLQRINSLRVKSRGAAARLNVRLDDIYGADPMPESEEEAMASDVDEMAATLDERYGKNGWDMYRGIFFWIARIDKDGSTHHGDTIGQAIMAAIDHKPLPVVPRRPSLFSASGADIYKSASLWRVRYDGRDCCVGARTKRAAWDWCEMTEYANKKAIENWEANYGWTLGKQEGVDFRYE
jgi:hypothetical protein